MDNKVLTYTTLWNLVAIDTKDHKIKDIATLFLIAMNDWPVNKQTDIKDFIKELKKYFGSPLTIEKVTAKKFIGQNVWLFETGSSIKELFDTSIRFRSQSNFDKIVECFLDYYNEEFKKVDFVAELQYLSTEQGGRQTPAKSGYRPQIKFDFTEMQTSGQQTFLDKDTVYPGGKVCAKIKIVSPEYYSACLSEGMTFEFREGNSIIGIGRIENIINDKLEKTRA